MSCPATAGEAIRPGEADDELLMRGGMLLADPAGRYAHEDAPSDLRGFTHGNRRRGRCFFFHGQWMPHLIEPTLARVIGKTCVG